MKTKNFFWTLMFCALSLFGGFAPVHAQDWLPDLALREAIREEIGLPTDVPLTKQHLLWLMKLNANNKGIFDITGLEFATNLVVLHLGGNENYITDLRPLANLTNLRGLHIWHTPGYGGAVISLDIRPLAHLIHLEVLSLEGMGLSDITVLADLKKLRVLHLTHNFIEDFSPLADLTHLRVLWIKNNWGRDFGPLKNLNLTDFRYDELCEIIPSGAPGTARIQNRKFPSVFYAFNDYLFFNGSLRDVIEERETLGEISLHTNERLYYERVSQHDLHFGAHFQLDWHLTKSETTRGLSTRIAGNLEWAKAIRSELLQRNPNMVFLTLLQLATGAHHTFFPPDSDFWVRDKSGQIVKHPYPTGEFYLIDFLKPEVQNLMVKRIVAIDNCGLFDGVMFDGFLNHATNLYRHLNISTPEAIIQAIENIFRAARSQVRDDFLIMVNANRTKLPRYADYVNGTFMEVSPDVESGVPHENLVALEQVFEPDGVRFTTSGGIYTYKGLAEIENTLLWAEENLRYPQINGLRAEGLAQYPSEGPENRRWMRVFTTMSLTHSDGYVLYTIGSDAYGLHHSHIWYDFWDADLGQPIGEKAQRYENQEGLFIREFTNGWAVYNRSGEPQTLTLPAMATGVESDHRGINHTVPDLDGEIYLKMPTLTADVNADGVINVLDLIIVSQALGEKKPDLNDDGIVNVLDLIFVAQRIGE